MSLVSSAVAVSSAAMMMVTFATGMYNLQSWLERNSYDRHFED